MNVVILCAVEHGVRKALKLHKDFLVDDKRFHHRSRVLHKLVTEHRHNLKGNNKYTCIAHAARNLTRRQTLKLYKDFYPGDRNRNRKLNQVIKKYKPVMKYNPVNLEDIEIKRRMADLSPILRRKARDLLPFQINRLPRLKVRYEDEDEEDCWNTVMPGGRAEADLLTLDDKLMLPASVRSEFTKNIDLI